MRIARLGGQLGEPARPGGPDGRAQVPRRRRQVVEVDGRRCRAPVPRGTAPPGRGGPWRWRRPTAATITARPGSASASMRAARAGSWVVVIRRSFSSDFRRGCIKPVSARSSIGRAHLRGDPMPFTDSGGVFRSDTEAWKVDQLVVDLRYRTLVRRSPHRADRPHLAGARHQPRTRPRPLRAPRAWPPSSRPWSPAIWRASAGPGRASTTPPTRFRPWIWSCTPSAPPSRRSTTAGRPRWPRTGCSDGVQELPVHGRRRAPTSSTRPCTPSWPG